MLSEKYYIQLSGGEKYRLTSLCERIAKCIRASVMKDTLSEIEHEIATAMIPYKIKKSVTNTIVYYRSNPSVFNKHNKLKFFPLKIWGKAEYGSSVISLNIFKEPLVVKATHSITLSNPGGFTLGYDVRKESFFLYIAQYEDADPEGVTTITREPIGETPSFVFTVNEEMLGTAMPPGTYSKIIEPGFFKLELFRVGDKKLMLLRWADYAMIVPHKFDLIKFDRDQLKEMLESMTCQVTTRINPDEEKYIEVAFI